MTIPASLSVLCEMKESHRLERCELFQAARPFMPGAQCIRPNSELITPKNIESVLYFPGPPPQARGSGAE